MGRVHIMDHPLVHHKIDYIRRKEVGTKEFREIIEEISMLMCYEATRGLKLADVEIETPICKMTGKELAGRKLAVVPILRAGLGMVEGILKMIPAAKIGHIGLYRDPETLQPVEYYCKLRGRSDACYRRIQFRGAHHAEGKRGKKYDIPLYPCSTGRTGKASGRPSGCGHLCWGA